MGIILFSVLVSYFLLGGILMFLVTRNKSREDKIKNWTKFVALLIIVNTLFFSMLFDPIFFKYLSIVIILFGYFEIIRLIIYRNKPMVGIFSIIFLSLFFYGFHMFSMLEQNILFYVLFVVTIFDAFSQLTGQLFGRRKLLPNISPNKTVEGLFGGFLFAVISSVIAHNLFDISLSQSIYMGIGVSSFAFIGDISASYIKRKFGVKDFGKHIPGHGGFLDRFDSLIFSGSFIYLFSIFT